ncbi:hypothetical protein OH76DRAFT_1484663 [Lentinus brumalis]|uniref:Uncharacterized protein n=1 Tax=Lentinus brumalis TaxID=2498619 RepID=A0A371D4W3_9APHY|nr:hypothetical protein OH76DRAFT_1484663 [Polyporus brumalis]
MADLALKPEIASEFVRFLDAQLKEAREQLQRSTDDNVALRREFEAFRSDAGTASHGSAERSEIESLRAEVSRLRKELEDAQESTRSHQAEASTWRTRYEQLKPQLANSAAHTAQILEKMREELAATTPHGSSTGQTLIQFRALLHTLPSVAASASPSGSKVVFHGTKLPPLLSKATLKACTGGVCFFGHLLEWVAASSQHAYTIFPEYRYNPKPSEGEPTWTAATDCDSLVGQQRELFYVDAGNICYAGTFLCHAGPRSVKAAVLAVDTESVAQAVARKTFNVNIKSSQSRQAKAKTYMPLLADLYAEGTATVRILGLQRVGFNKKLFEILRKAHDQRDRRRSESASTSTLSDMLVETGTPSTHASQSGRRKRDWFDEIWDDGEETEGGGPGPSKVPRLDEDEVNDMMTVWRA